ncbi:MAG: hypothetical protein RIS90_84, partial [Pseudomonadota bacterium]
VLQALLQSLQHNTRLAICSGLTLSTSQCVSQTVKHWRNQSPAPGPDKHTPAIFALGR